MFSLLDVELQKELLNFVKNEKANKNAKPLKKHLIEEILSQICKNEREITGLSTCKKTGDVFVRFSFVKDEENKNV